MITVSVIKGDVGSGGGHTKPSVEMLKSANAGWLRTALDEEQIHDFRVMHTGDDICLLIVHPHGSGAPFIHDGAWEVLMDATEVAKREGNYGAGQDMLADAPSGNVRGAGPGVAEITFDQTAKERPAEAFMLFAGDKCGPGAFNFPLWAVFTSPMYCSGLMLPNLIEGFEFTIIDMEHTEGDKILKLKSPEQHIQIAALLRDENRYAVLSIRSRKFPDQMVVSTSTDRLHSIAGVYKGKDDPVCLARSQGIFPAPEELVMPYATAHYVAGDARGSHHMTLMPVAINTAVTGPYCQPVVSALAFSVNTKGKLTEGVDIFGNPVWEFVRQKAMRKSLGMRDQGVFGPAMLDFDQLEYGPMKQTIADLEAKFNVE